MEETGELTSLRQNRGHGRVDKFKMYLLSVYCNIYKNCNASKYSIKYWNVQPVIFFSSTPTPNLNPMYFVLQICTHCAAIKTEYINLLSGLRSLKQHNNNISCEMLPNNLFQNSLHFMLVGSLVCRRIPCLLVTGEADATFLAAAAVGSWARPSN